MKKHLTLLLSLAALACGIGVVILADRSGWLSTGGDQANAAACRHQVPAGQCPFCDPSLIATVGECHEHGVPEALCTRCRPALVAAFKVENDWCAGHGVPESQCLLCNPELAQSSSASTALSAAPASIELVYAPEAFKSQRAPSVTCATEQKVLRFASADVAQLAGIEVVPVARRPVTQMLQCNAELAFNGNRFAHISPRAAGVVSRVDKQLGDRVSTGDVLAIVDSVELGSAKAELLQAHATANLWQKNYEQQRTLAESGVKSLRELLEAETKAMETSIALARATQRLRNLGLTDQGIEAVQESRDTKSLLEVTAPFDGVVVDRHAVRGEVVEPAHQMFSIADTSSMWAMLDLYEGDASSLRIGQSVTLALAGMVGQPVGGTITWISPQVDPQTRTLKARADIENANGLLRANMFGKASIAVHDREDLLVVPKQAVQWEGCCNVVFVQRGQTEFQPRKVRLGYETGDWCVVEEGVNADELVVTQGSFLLKTEVLKGSIGAGCCETHAGS